MSRTGKEPIIIPNGVEIKIENNNVSVKSQKGEMSYVHPNGVKVIQEDGKIKVDIENDKYRNYWGLVRTLISNMIEGLTNGFKKELLVIGVGYNAKMQGNKLVLSLGLSHPVEYEAPKGIDISVDKGPKGVPLIRIEGCDKQKVGEIASIVRGFRKPEPYKGKGIRYIDENIKVKEGKKASK